MFAQIEQNRDDDANQAAVERHAAVPDRDEVDWVGEVRGGVVLADDVVDDEERTAANEHAQQRVEEEVLDLLPRQPQTAPPLRPAHPQIDRNKTDEVRYAVPMDGKRSQAERDRIDVRIGEPMRHQS